MRSVMVLVSSAATILTVAGVSLLAAPAHAQSFQGPRVELNAGYDALRAKDGVAATPDTLEMLRVGGALGYDWELGGNFVVGGEAGFGWDVAGRNAYTTGSTAARVNGGYDLDLSLRAGVKLGASSLVYVKGGYTNSELRARLTVGTTTTKVKDSDDGYRIGVGVEQAFGEHLYAKAEYRYSDYGSDVTRHQALLGLGYRF